MKNMAFRRHGPLLMAVHNGQSPAPDEWAAYLQASRDLDAELGGQLEKARALIFTDGGGPNSGQRVEMGKVLQGRSFRVAIVTDSLLVRGIISAVSLVNPGGQAVFVPKDWKKACAWVDIAEDQMLGTLKQALALRHEITESKVLSSITL